MTIKTFECNECGNTYNAATEAKRCRDCWDKRKAANTTCACGAVKAYNSATCQDCYLGSARTKRLSTFIAVTEKYCSKCRVVKPITEFYNDATKDGAKRSQCKDCYRETGKIRKQRRNTKVCSTLEDRMKVKDNMLRNKYNMTLDQYIEMLYLTQNGKCALPTCEKVAPSTDEMFGANKTIAWHVDHDHRCCSGSKSCGQCVRGILCPGCNSLLASYWESEENRQRAFDYIDRLLPKTVEGQ